MVAHLYVSACVSSSCQSQRIPWGSVQRDTSRASSRFLASLLSKCKSNRILQSASAFYLSFLLNPENFSFSCFQSKLRSLRWCHHWNERGWPYLDACPHQLKVKMKLSLWNIGSITHLKVINLDLRWSGSFCRGFCEAALPRMDLRFRCQRMKSTITQNVSLDQKKKKVYFLF